jgi:hypothetical protein
MSRTPALRDVARVRGESPDPSATAVAKVVESTFRAWSLWRWAETQTRKKEFRHVCSTYLHGVVRLIDLNALGCTNGTSCLGT